MSEHKVPQDVEAEDKLLGPFSFRQFIYLLIALGSGALAFFLGRLAIPLALIPLPIVILFTVLALPLRKDQPMEAYLAALIRFYFSSRTRKWDSDGQQNLVEISNPVIDDEPRIKEVGGDEAAQRLSFLADIADTQGWATRGIGAPINDSILNDDVIDAANDAPDILDNNELTRSLDNMLIHSDQQVKQTALQQMQNDINQSNIPQANSPQIAQNPPISQIPPVQYGVQNDTYQSASNEIAQNDETLAASLLQQASSQIPAQPTQRKVIQPLAPTIPQTQPISPQNPNSQNISNSANEIPTEITNEIPAKQEIAADNFPSTSNENQVASVLPTQNSEIREEAQNPADFATTENPASQANIYQGYDSAEKSANSIPHDVKSDTIESDSNFTGEKSIAHNNDNDSQTVEISLH